MVHLRSESTPGNEKEARCSHPHAVKPRTALPAGRPATAPAVRLLDCPSPAVPTELVTRPIRAWHQLPFFLPNVIRRPRILTTPAHLPFHASLLLSRSASSVIALLLCFILCSDPTQIKAQPWPRPIRARASRNHLTRRG